MAATIEGKPAAEWFKAAAQRQKRSNAYAKYEEPAKAEPARQTAAMPKPANHASPAKAESKPDLDKLISSTQEMITKARGAPETKQAAPAKPARPAPGQAKGTEAEWTARRESAKGRSSLHRSQIEARRKAASYKGPTKYTPKGGLAESQMGEFSKTVKEAGKGIAKALNTSDPNSWINDPLGVRRRRMQAAK